MILLARSVGISLCAKTTRFIVPEVAYCVCIASWILSMRARFLDGLIFWIAVCLYRPVKAPLSWLCSLLLTAAVATLFCDHGQGHLNLLRLTLTGEIEPSLSPLSRRSLPRQDSRRGPKGVDSTTLRGGATPFFLRSTTTRSLSSAFQGLKGHR
jgi:hypothetical protein